MKAALTLSSSRRAIWQTCTFRASKFRVTAVIPLSKCFISTSSGLLSANSVERESLPQELPQYCPYTPGARLWLQRISDDGSSPPGRRIAATILQNFLPFTLSQVLKIKIDEPVTFKLPEILALKLFDRRFVHRQPEIERLWEPSMEPWVQKVVEEIQAGKRPVEADFSGDVNKWEDWKHEMYIQERLLDDRDREVLAYERLKDLQGSAIPRFYGLFECALPDRVQDNPAAGLTGIALEYIDGKSMDDLRVGENIKQEDAERMSQAALTIIRQLRKREVLHRDLRGQNLLIRSSDQSPVLIDFARAQIHDSSTSQEGWDKVVAFAEEIEQMRAVLKRRRLHEPTPYALPDPDPLFGYMFVNWYVEDESRSRQWREKFFEPVGLEGPEFKMVKNEEGEEFRYYFQKWKLKEGARTTENDK